MAILLIEDNPGEIRLMPEALKESRILQKMSAAKDGVEALRFLRMEGLCLDVPRPELILFDLNLLRKDGREVLAEIKANLNSEEHSNRSTDDLEGQRRYPTDRPRKPEILVWDG